MKTNPCVAGEGVLPKKGGFGEALTLSEWPKHFLWEAPERRAFKESFG